MDSHARIEADEKSDMDFSVQEKGTKLIGMKFITFEMDALQLARFIKNKEKD